MQRQANGAARGDSIVRWLLAQALAGSREQAVTLAEAMRRQGLLVPAGKVSTFVDSSSASYQLYSQSSSTLRGVTSLREFMLCFDAYFIYSSLEILIILSATCSTRARATWKSTAAAERRGRTRPQGRCAVWGRESSEFILAYTRQTTKI